MPFVQPTVVPVDVLEEEGLKSSADQLLTILLKVAQKDYFPKKQKFNPKESERFLRNLKDHGTMFDAADDANMADDLLNADILDSGGNDNQDDEIIEVEEDFEEEY